jgi:hypothetical protein
MVMQLHCLCNFSEIFKKCVGGFKDEVQQGVAIDGLLSVSRSSPHTQRKKNSPLTKPVCL